ncbi:MAG: hypothetical protein A3E36_03015 [Candidatus Andersenbacteria bacterium RIFCSPHIGHO2_12_FULL_45_11b]|uniref:Uncharacterized protein n=1 Tax=Candidatus Andersenbacteria bacterium RIFCSPHIGHO2_12_FULL_45_11b TaxID=1797282 RepID=A0A1G1XBR7_9BACT|nr:MAG: hypothetical protein A3E36_03015 [Candidatus Andersenbacteria bacterium RIFCSPHIGHO2_12_FULL_45_11b]
MAIANGHSGFSQEIQIFFRTAQDLGRLRYQGDRAQFEQTLLATGMDAGEVERYWELIDVSKNDAWQPVGYASMEQLKSNSVLAQNLGLALQNAEGQPPRNWLLYRLFSCFFPGILAANYAGEKHLTAKDTRIKTATGYVVNPQHRTIRFSALPIAPAGAGTREGNPMPLYQVVQGKEPARFQAQVIRAAASLRTAFGDTLGMQIAELLLSLQMLVPSELVARALRKVLDAGERGEEVIFAGAFCPDYAYEETGSQQVPYRYTFDGLGMGVGLVAKQFARIIPQLSRFFAEIGIRHRFVIGIGDFEADSETVLQRVGVDRREFIRRCQCSLNAFYKLMPEDVPIELELFDAKRGNGKLRQYAAESFERMVAGDFGMMPTLHPDLEEVIMRIPGQYRTFYERWHGVQMDDATVRNIVYSQGGEYAAVARIYYEDLGDNVIFLAGDRPEMNRFNAFYAPLPVLCAKRAY